jgi:phospholipid/cholesterol/gamma-HCH transport system permease protein
VSPSVVIIRTRERIARIGASSLDFLDAALALWMVFLSTLAGVIRGGRPRGEVVAQMYHVGNRSLLFIAVTLGFIGMVMVYQSCLQVERITGDLSMVGAEFARLMVQDFGPTLTAMMLATRVGAGIAAEIGSMKVTEQIDALRMSGVAPIDYLIVPRFLACVVMTVVLSIFGTLIAYCAGGLTAWASFDVNPRLFFNLDKLDFVHLILGLIKALSYGVAIPVIAGFCGLQARGSSEGVGSATTRAVIGSSFAVIAIDFLISAAAIYTVGDIL